MQIYLMKRQYSLGDSLIKAKENQLLYSYERNIGIAEGWMKPDYTDASWSFHDIPSIWEELEDINEEKGVVWFRKKMVIPSSWKSKELKLDLGILDERDATYVNGKLVGSVENLQLWNTFRSYQIPAALIENDTITIAVRMTNLYGKAGFVSKAEEIKIYASDMPQKLQTVTWKVALQNGIFLSGNFRRRPISKVRLCYLMV